MSTQQASIQSLVERLEAIEAIRQLKARYLNACDQRDSQGVSSCFAEGDVLIDMGHHLGVFHHRDEFVAMYPGYGCHEYILDMHHGANPEIEVVDASHARALWSLNYRNINTRDRTVTLLSVLYHDEYAKLAGEWKIVTCRVEYKTPLHLSYEADAFQTLLAAKSVAEAVPSPGVAE
jgi:hypothetical protein